MAPTWLSLLEVLESLIPGTFWNSIARTDPFSTYSFYLSHLQFVYLLPIAQKFVEIFYLSSIISLIFFVLWGLYVVLSFSVASREEADTDTYLIIYIVQSEVLALVLPLAL